VKTGIQLTKASMDSRWALTPYLIRGGSENVGSLVPSRNNKSVSGVIDVSAQQLKLKVTV